MNADQIRSELERRAGSAAPQPDWPKRALLPAVWRELDARPQPVVTSRWSTGVGVAALVTALLVLVVAVPRLAPQPAGPSPHELEVLSAQTFAAGVQSGALTGQTVLVNGAIVQYDGPPIFGGACGPNGPACLLGQLESVEPRVTIFGPDIAVTDADQSSVQQSNGWPLWRRVAPPLRGTLMLSVDEQSVEYLGRVVPGGDSLFWSAGQVKTQLQINARDLDEVVLVNSWLVGLDALVSCAVSPSPIPGLPLRDDCGLMSWLSDEAVVATPESPVVSPQAIGVQPDAFSTYAPDPSARTGPWLTPQRAVYAVARRLYANGCIDPAGPCWGWSMVGRLSQPAPDVTPPSLPVVPTPQIAPSPTIWPSPTGIAIECPPTWHVSPDDVSLNALHATIIDHTGLVIGCDKPDEPMFDWMDDHPPRLGNPGGDTQLLQIEWVGDPCGAAREITLSRSGNAFALEGRSTYSGEFCVLPRVIHAIVLRLNAPIEASNVIFDWNTTNPAATPGPTPQSGIRVFTCAASEALAGAEITLIDHSGAISACSMGQADVAPDGTINVGPTHLPNRLTATWTVNTGCPADDQLEFWGPIDGSVGLAEYVLQLARQRARQHEPATCGDVLDIRQVEVEFNDEIRPEDILAISVNRSTADGTVSNVASSGVFDLQLAASQAWEPNVPIDIASRLANDGTDPVTVSGWWRPDFAFTSLTGGPSFPPVRQHSVVPRCRSRPFRE